jgi:hypothetical protein
LGRSENARQAARGCFEWRSKGLYCCIEDGRLADISVSLVASRGFAAFGGRVLYWGEAISVSRATTPEMLVGLIGEPFGRSNNTWDDAVVLFYEYDCGEVQWAFGKKGGTLEMIEVWYEPELSQGNACETYGIGKPFPEELRRTLSSG